MINIEILIEIEECYQKYSGSFDGNPTTLFTEVATALLQFKKKMPIYFLRSPSSTFDYCVSKVSHEIYQSLNPRQIQIRHINSKQP